MVLSLPMTLNWRQQQAAATKRQIVGAARRLIVDRGYVGTTIETIAEEAGVAVPTVYKALGNKRTIARELNELIATEAEVADLVPRAMASGDPEEIIAVSVKIGRSLHEHSGDLIAAVHMAAAAEPELAAVLAEGTHRHVSGVRGAAERLRALNALNPTLTIEHAAGLLGHLSSAETFATMTRDHSWSVDECETWLTDAAVRLLL